MRRLSLAECTDEMIAARPVHGRDGLVLITPGTRLDARRRALLDDHAVEHLLVVQEGEELPDPTIPIYMDRYAEDFAPRLHAVFHDLLDRPAMQELFLAALGHASACYRRYRMEESAGEERT